MSIFKKKIKNDSVDSSNDLDNKNLEQVNKEIYKHSLEITVANKTLSLLKKLYKISLLTLDTKDLSLKMSETIRIDLEIDFVGIFSFDQSKDSLTPFGFSGSEKLVELENSLNFSFQDCEIKNISKREVLNEAVYGKIQTVTKNIEDIWGDSIEKSKLETFTRESYLKSVLLYPLLTENKFFGILILGFNREYNLINEHEKDEIKSFIDVVTVALNKSSLHRELEDANEKLKALDKLKTEFLSLASHQLRTPLTAISGYASMIYDGFYGEIDNTELKETINIICKSSKSLIKVVEDLLNVSKIEQGGMKYEMAPFDLSEVAKEMVDSLSINAKDRNLDLSFECAKDDTCMVIADKEKIRQVVLNFIDNSIKYTKEGSIKVKVEKIKDKVVFSVKDTGMGMTNETKESLFKKFARGDSDHMNTSGTGLGLYLTKEISEAHGGRVYVESEGLGKGSTFFMELNAVK